MDGDAVMSKEDFNQKLNEAIEAKKSNNSMWNREQLSKVIKILKSGEKRSSNYYYLRKYELMQIGDQCRVIVKRKNEDSVEMVHVLAREDYYDQLVEAHRRTGHGGRDRVLYYIKFKYRIPRDAVEIFVSSCPTCARKKSAISKGVVVKPITSHGFNSRGQVDLIDLSSCPDDGYYYLLVIQDHATKFLQVRPLKSKHASNVAKELYVIFFTFGAPFILQSDNGREFVAEVIKELAALWPECKIIHGRPRHPQTQGSVERANGDFESMLKAWMMQHNSNSWSRACFEVQWQKNTSLHRVIGRSPYEAVFGPIKYGLSYLNLPSHLVDNIESEEDLERVLANEQQDENNVDDMNPDPLQMIDDMEIDITSSDRVNSHAIQSDHEVEIHHAHGESGNILASEEPCDESDTVRANSDSSQPLLPISNPTAGSNNLGFERSSSIPPRELLSRADNDSGVNDTNCITCDRALEYQNTVVCTKCNSKIHTDCQISNSDEEYSVICALCARGSNLKRVQDDCFRRQRAAAEKMTNFSSAMFPPLSVNDCITLGVPNVDRGPLDFPRIHGIVTDIQNGVYQIGTRDGLLKGWFSRPDIQKTDSGPLSINDVRKDTSLTLREAASKQSMTGGQGVRKCNCRAASNQCKTNRCSCLKRNVKCGSRCHGSSTCCNK